MKTSWILFLTGIFFHTLVTAGPLSNAVRWETKQGTRVVFYQTHEVPMLDLSVTFSAGSAYDGDKFGLSALTTELLTQGTHHLNATQLAEKFADVGAQYQSDASRDMATIEMRTLTEKHAFKQAIDTFVSLVTEPRFDKATFQLERNQQLMAIAHAKSSPGDVANRAFFDHLYGKHPYAHAVQGIQSTVERLTQADVVQFYQRYFVRENAVIVMVGDIDLLTAQQIANKITQPMQSGKKAAAIPKATQTTQHEVVPIDYQSEQTMIRLGQVGIDHDTPDYTALMVGNYILGGDPLVSRLSHEIRAKRGLTYGVASEFMPMPGEGPFLISLATQQKQAAEALNLASTSLQSFINQGPKKKELEAAKRFLMGHFPLSLASNAQISSALRQIAFYHLPDDYLDTYQSRIEAVTEKDIQEAFKRHINPDNLLLVAVGTSTHALM